MGNGVGPGLGSRPVSCADGSLHALIGCRRQNKSHTIQDGTAAHTQSDRANFGGGLMCGRIMDADSDADALLYQTSSRNAPNWLGQSELSPGGAWARLKRGERPILSGTLSRGSCLSVAQRSLIGAILYPSIRVPGYLCLEWRGAINHRGAGAKAALALLVRSQHLRLQWWWWVGAETSLWSDLIVE